jgi:hypothetical protein
MDYLASPGRLACPDLGVVLSTVRPTSTTNAFLEHLHYAMAFDNVYTDISLVQSRHILPRVSGRAGESDAQLVNLY